MLDNDKIISYILYGMSDTLNKEIRLGTDFTIVSLQDYEELIKYSWHIVIRHNNKYVARSVKVNGKVNTVYMHRQIMNCTNGQEVHHKDDDGLNNTRENLEVCSHSYNMSFRRGKSRMKSIYIIAVWAYIALMLGGLI